MDHYNSFLFDLFAFKKDKTTNILDYEEDNIHRLTKGLVDNKEVNVRPNEYLQRKHSKKLETLDEFRVNDWKYRIFGDLLHPYCYLKIPIIDQLIEYDPKYRKLSNIWGKFISINGVYDTFNDFIKQGKLQKKHLLKETNIYSQENLWFLKNSFDINIDKLRKNIGCDLEWLLKKPFERELLPKIGVTFHYLVHILQMNENQWKILLKIYRLENIQQIKKYFPDYDSNQFLVITHNYVDVEKEIEKKDMEYFDDFLRKI